MAASTERPRVVVATVASVDGRITSSRAELLLDPAVGARWEAAWPPDVGGLITLRDQWLAEAGPPTVTLEGSGSFVGDDATSPWPGRPHGSGAGEFLPRGAPRWFVVVDGRGRVDWTFTGDEETALFVLACRGTPAGYLHRLRELGVGFLVAGEGRVDLPLALGRLPSLLGVTTVLSEGGGALNAALFRAGLVDELHVITFPALVGGLGTPSFFDGPQPPPGLPAQRLRVVDRALGEHGSMLTRYLLTGP